MDALEALGDHRADAEQLGALRRPVARGAVAVFCAGEDDERHLLLGVFHRRVVDRHLGAVGPVLGLAALRHVAVVGLAHEVLDADVGEGATHHDLVVAAPRAVLVEVLQRDLPLGEVGAGGRGLLDRAGRRDVVGGDLVAEQREDARVDDVSHRLRLHLHALEVGRVLHVGRAHVPGIGLALRRVHLAPMVVAVEDVGVARLEHLPRHVLGDVLVDLLGRRPDVLQEDVLAVLVLADRVLGQVELHRAGDRMGDDERRRGEVVRLHVRRDAAFEIAVAGEHGRGDDAVVVDRLRDRLRQRARIADAGRAAEADEVEADLVEILLQARRRQVFGDDLAAGRERGLHPRLAGQAALGGLARQQAGADQHVGVRRVGAGGDGGNHHVAVADLVALARDGVALLDVRRLLVLGPKRLAEALADLFERDAALGPLRTGHRRHDVAEVELERVGEHRVRRVLPAVEALRLGIGFDQLDALLGARGHGEIGERLLVDREEAAGRAVFRRHVADRRAVGERHGREAGAVELDELADDLLGAQHLRDGEHEVGGGDAGPELAGEAEADHLGQQHGERLAEHAGLGLDAADAPAEHGEAVDHGGVRVGADERVRIRHLDRLALVVLLLLRPDGLGEVLEVHLVADAGAGRHDAEVVEGVLAPLEELVALAVARIFQIDVGLERLVGPEGIDDHRMVDDEVDRHQRVDLLRVAAERGHRVAHRREVDDGGDAGEILHQDAGRAEGDLGLGLALVVEPGGDALDVGLFDRLAVLVAQQVLEQHLHREGQFRDALQPVLLGFLQRVIMVGLVTHAELFAALEAVERGHRRVPGR